MNQWVIVRKSPFRNYLLPNSLLTSKVNLGLEWEQSQSQDKCSSYSHCHKNPVDVMIDGNAWHLKISDRNLKKSKDCIFPKKLYFSTKKLHFFTKLLPTVRKNGFCDREKLLNFWDHKDNLFKQWKSECFFNLFLEVSHTS